MVYQGKVGFYGVVEVRYEVAGLVDGFNTELLDSGGVLSEEKPGEGVGHR